MEQGPRHRAEQRGKEERRVEAQRGERDDAGCQRVPGVVLPPRDGHGAGQLGHLQRSWGAGYALHLEEPVWRWGVTPSGTRAARVGDVLILVPLQRKYG